MKNILLTYFQSYQQYFWQWEDGTHVVAIPGSHTIAYKDHLGDILEKLSPGGLPPFGSLLLAVVATNPNGAVALDVVYKLTTTAIGTTDNTTVSKAISFLKLLSEVPPIYKQGHKRILLFQTIFERCHQIISLKDSRSLCSFYRTTGDEFEQMSDQIAFNFNVFDTDFRTLAVLDSKFSSVDEIIKKIAGIPEPSQVPIEFDENVGSEESPAKDLVDQLIEHNKTFHVGSLVRWLWAGLNIPVHSALPSEQPLGGISDLTNKGEFDKLLISEYAYDDLTFLSRLANNEALYFHREIPPMQNDLHRVILIDSSLKNWGTPRTIAFAVMLAIARHPKTDIVCESYVLGSDGYYPIAFDSIDKLIDALMIIDAGLHAADGLELFIKDHGADKNKEIFLITESSSLNQAPFLKVMHEHADVMDYVIHTDSEGNVDVYKKHQRARKHVQHIKVPLDTLWKKGGPPSMEALQPSSFKANYPILFRDPGYKKRILVSPDGEIFQVSDDRSILRLYDKTADKHRKGWELVFEGLPFKTEVCEVGMTPEGHYLFLLFNVSSREILIVNINTGETKSFHFEPWRSSRNVSFIFDIWKLGDTEKSFIHPNIQGSWKIGLDGTVERAENRIDQSVLDGRARVLAQAAQKYHSGIGVFRNVRSVFISPANELVFNIHSLRFTSDNLKLVSTGSKVVKVESQRVNDKEFRFPDGSTVSVCSAGMFTLKSSDTKLPAIYIPSSLDSALGVVAGNNFAGNLYYFKEPIYDIILHDAGPEHLQVLREIRISLPDLSITEAREMVNSTLVNIGKLPMTQALHLKKSVEKFGASLELRPEHESLQEISIAEFFKEYITKFINTILKHGA